MKVDDQTVQSLSSASYEVRLLGSEDVRVFDNVANGVFDNPIKADRSTEFLGDPRHHIVAALSEGQLVGIATGFHYVYPDHAPALFVIDVVVTPAFRRQGVGKALLRALLQHGQSIGCIDAWVGTEVSNVAAQKLYSSNGANLDPDDFVTYSFDLSG